MHTLLRRQGPAGCRPEPTGEGGAGEPLPSRAFLLPACAERGWEFRAAHLRPAVSKSAPSVGSPLPRLRLQKSGVGLVVYPGTPPHLGWPRNLKICSFLTYGRSRSLSVLSLSFRRRARAGDIRVLVLIRPVCPDCSASHSMLESVRLSQQINFWVCSASLVRVVESFLLPQVSCE